MINLFIYGTGFVLCAFILTSMIQLIYERILERKTLWHDVFFWLAGGMLLTAGGFGWMAIYRTWRILSGNPVVYAQPETPAVVMVVAIMLGLNSYMRAIAIQHPVRGTWYLLFCVAWAVFCYFGVDV